MYDSANWATETLIVRNTGAFSISSGPKANTLYLQIASLGFSSGPLDTYDLVTRGTTSVGGDIPGNAFGEGRDGYLYSGSGWSLYRIDPNTGSSTYVGDGTWGYAGDLAVDPQTDIMYGAVNGQWGVTLVTVERATGAQRVVGPLNVSGDIWGLGFSGNGTLFAAGPDGGYGGAIYQIDKATGAASQVRALNYEPYDMATQPYTTDEDEHIPVKGPEAPASQGEGAASPADDRIYYEEDLDGGATAIRWQSGRLWERGAPTAGPRGAASGTQCIATRASGGYPGFCCDTFETPPLRLAGARRPVLVIRHWYDLEDGHDGGVVHARTAHGDVVLEPGAGYPRLDLGGLGGRPGFSGSSGGWVDAYFELSGLAGREDVRIAFTFGSDGAGDGAGWFVDDILVAEASVVEARLGRARLGAAGGCSIPIAKCGFELPARPIPGDRLVSDVIDFAGARRAVMRFAHDYDMQSSRDGGRIVASADGESWVVLTPIGGYPSARVEALGGPGFSGASGGFRTSAVDLTPVLERLGARVRIGFEYASDGSTNDAGWAIDRVRVTVER